jgi:hypothetical protein
MTINNIEDKIENTINSRGAQIIRGIKNYDLPY